MLKLRRIELHGFKSFYDEAEIAVHPEGITAIVGPNGCGKSNVSDALAWVLGEQKPRMLRGNRMQDVIFNGSGKRAPLGMARVTVTLLDEAPAHNNGGPPPGPVELAVERRLYRSGESRYMLNGRACRLRDVQDVFMGTGLGPNHYAIIEQGRIDQLLAAKPSDRRMLIEEAAGVTRFRAKRKLAESRLEASRNNLSRVNDILVEVERQRNSLRRQAGRARRYRALRRRLREVLTAVFSTRADALVAGEQRVAEALAGIDAEGRELEARLADLDRRIHRRRAESEDAEKRLDDTRQLGAATELDLQKTTQRIEHLAEQVRSEERHSRELLEEQERVNGEIERRRSAIAHARGRLADVEARLVERRAEAAACGSELDAVSQRRRDEEAAIEQLRNRRFDLVGKEAGLGNGLKNHEETLGRLDARTGRVRDEDVEARRELEANAARLRTVEIEHSSKRTEIGRLAEERHGLEAELGELRAALDAAEAEAGAAAAREQAARHRLEAIRELSLAGAYGSESVDAFFDRVRQEAWSPVGILADFVEVEPGDEAVVEDLMRDELQYVVVERLDHAVRALAIVREAGHGRLDLLVLDREATPRTPGAVLDGAVPVSRIVRLGDRVRSFAARLDEAYVVDDLERAWELSNRHAGSTFAARGGGVVRDGVIRWGGGSARGPLSIKREMRELDRRAEAARAASETASRQAAGLRDRVGEFDERFVRLAEALQESEKEALGLDHGVRGVTAELERSRQRVRLAEAEARRLGAERAELEAAMSAARRELEVALEEKARLDGEIESRQRSRARLQDAGEKLAAAAAGLRSDLAVLEERKGAVAAETAALDSEAAALEARLRRTNEQIAEAASSRSDAEKEIADARGRLETLTRTAQDARRRIETVSAELERLRGDLHAAESGWDAARTAQEAWKDRHNKLQIERNGIVSSIENLADICRSELGDSIESVCLDSFATLDETALAAYESERAELRRTLDSIGSVNPMAVEEYEEAARRFEELSGERQDLLDAIRNTTEAIEEIDRVSKKQFGEAFDAINVRFAEAFAELFGGGHGELRLMAGGDGDADPEAGIEIIAQPPGKKLQNVLLLSGGEKALAALSLLIAMFRFKPSPFCVLDEVDAPLDDANVGRFAKLVEAMSRDTQFIVITHSKRTMEAASHLYGVTMAEAGVSSVVSVQLN